MPLPFFGLVLKELQKQFPRGGDAEPLVKCGDGFLTAPKAMPSPAPGCSGFCRTACRGLLPPSPGRLMAVFASFG
ncbi:hypothetical protein [Mesorhizobium sp.]|uniref:hypothetical protein n=1 Tax=Mesorhizobium sp. TaxID=1871066 RepID=UPI000FE501CE|nr:hypothetical protein [Mesorhizobium sp.]RWK41334.1 MAG: hypothetical protein EOR46_16870 [Mesorhizobium sp.]RWK67339.1 MAG: hypothetical protein EOR54_19555 [Mesorhizobium sp.]RWK74801.1 MAG: hypothetical protein EOR50_18690 [Mesorhizobium sp.]RWK77907.1 MAG: hypothetical protein EOR51_25300 [Mesorhizobium sp.]RWL03316.1 MAG: hypothetical protein EOR55_19245 [Mesorhizobium sp.]